MTDEQGQIVVTGVGLATCLGLSAEDTWRGVLAGRAGFRPMSALEGTSGGSRCDGGQAPDLEPRFMPDSPREVRYLRWVLNEALEQANAIDRAICAPGRCGYVLGTTLQGMRAAGKFLRTGRLQALSSFLAGAVLRDATAGLWARGPRMTTCAACSSGLASIGAAVALLRAGVCDMVVAGGYDPVSEYVYAGFTSMRLTTAGPLRPFCKDRAGMKIAEGYGVLVLEALEHATGRGAPPLACVRGTGKSSDCHHLTQPLPSGEGTVRAIVAALKNAEVDASQIGLVSAHATGTPNNDDAEAKALMSVFGDALDGIPVVAFKSHIGHTLGAAGAAEAVLSIMALRDQVAPPTANVSSEDLEFPRLQLRHGTARPTDIDCVMNLSIGFGGANSCLVLSLPNPVIARSTRGRGNPRRRVLITGIGILHPLGIGRLEFSQAISAARGPATQVSRSIDQSRYEHLLNARRTRRMSEYVKLTLGATALAVADAHIDNVAAFTDACDAILGTTHGALAYTEQYYGEVVEKGLDAGNPMLFAESVPNIAAAQLSMMLGVRGFCQTIIGSRTDGLDALMLAAERIALGLWDRAIVSAAEERGERRSSKLDNSSRTKTTWMRCSIARSAAMPVS